MNNDDHDLIAALANYGAVLEAESGEQLRPTSTSAANDISGDNSEVAPAEVAQHQHGGDSRRLWLVAAGLLVLAGGIFAVRGLRDGESEIVATSPATLSAEESTSPLFVLPVSTSEGDVSNGQLDEQTPPHASERVVGGLIGRASDRGYIDLIRINILPLASPALDLDEFDRVGTTSLFRSQTGSGEQLMQERGDTAVLLSTLNGAIGDELLEMITLNPDGSFDFDGELGFEVIDRWTLDPAASQIRSASFDLETAGRRFLIETADIPVTTVLDIASRAIQTSVNDQPGWLIEIDGNPYGIAVQVTPTQAFFVTGSEDAPLTADELEAVAESLQIVDRATWFAAFPTLDDTTD